MEETRFGREAAAYASLQGLMQEAQRTKELFDAASLPVPAPLARMLGGEEESENGVRRGVEIPPLPGPPRPSGVPSEWVWIYVDDCMSGTLVQACLREFDGSAKPKQLVDRITSLRPDLGAGGIYNVGPRLEKSGTITRRDGAWNLVSPEEVPKTQGKHVWASVKDFQKQEVASHRRMIIVHLLKMYKGGLQVAQIVEQLSRFDQCKAPVSKDLVKADMEILAGEKKVRRTGNSKKWVVVEGNPQD